MSAKSLDFLLSVVPGSYFGRALLTPVNLIQHQKVSKPTPCFAVLRIVRHLVFSFRGFHLPRFFPLSSPMATLYI